MKAAFGAHPRWLRLSISTALIGLAVLLLVLIVAATSYQLTRGWNMIMSQTEQQVSRLDMVFAEQTGRAVETVDFIIRNVIEAWQAQGRKPPADGVAGLRELLARRIAGVRQVSELAVADAAGQVLVSSHAGPPAQLPPPARALIGEQSAHPRPDLQFSEPFRGPDGRWTALMWRPLIGSDDKFEGAVLAYLNLAYFEDFYRAVDLAENGAIVLHLRDGTVLARYPHNDAVIGQSYADLPPFKDVLAHSTAGTLIMDSPTDGSRRILAIRALKAFPLAVNVSVGQSRVLAPWRREAWTFSLVALAASLAVVGLLLLLARRSRELEDEIAGRERAEMALRRAQRVEVLGQLTGGVAHDFNNLLTVIRGNIERIADTARLDSANTDRLATMLAAAERGATLTTSLLAFARRQPLSPRPVDLNAAINGMRNFLRSAVGGKVLIEVEPPPPDPWPAMIDPTQFELVVLNLVINARDAMPDGGTVTITTANVHRGPPRDAEEPPAGDYVMLRVRDTGIGMAPEVQAMAFEPFYTTKPPGTGSGLGLSQVFGTARQSGGGVQLESAPGRGTAVSVYLPRAAPLVTVETTQETTADPEPRAVVLVVDDDPGVLATTADVLEGRGYSVLQAGSGNAALGLLQQNPSVNLLLTDVVMAPMSGQELAREAAKLHPHLPILFISGYAGAAGLGGDTTEYRLIQKPFSAAELHQHIEAALSRPQPHMPAA